jgi:nitrite reductase/ring-hydroxylating ferredoxin subunit
MTITETPGQESAEFPPGQYAHGPNGPDVRARVPFAMSEPGFVPKQRYYDREFFELEKKNLWPRMWQMAARLEEIPNPGDYSEYEVVGNSILIVRQQDGSVKALHNACRHRATQLAKGCGRLPGGQIVCPFHGWRWNLDGSNSFVFMDRTFDSEALRPEDIRLPECKVEVWAGMVWINMDPDAPPLAEAFSPAMQILDTVGLENMRVKWWKQVVLPANWKLCMEVFMEGYHLLQTHPQMILGGGQQFAEQQVELTEYTAFRGGHGRFQSPPEAALVGSDGETFIQMSRVLAEGQDAMALDRDVMIFEGLRNKVDINDPAFPMQAIMALYEYAQGANIPMAPPSPHIAWGGEMFVFPNSFFLPMYSNCLTYRARPYGDDPEKCLFDMWSLTTYPVGREPERAELLGVFDPNDTENWGLIPRQDFGNIERQARGLHTQGFEKMRMSTNVEKMILNMHEEVDRVLAR